MAQRRTLAELVNAHEKLRSDFIGTELDLAFTFSQVAATAGRKDISDRNVRNAWKAYDTVVHILQSAKFSVGKRREIRKRLARLRALLSGLDEATASER